MSEFAYFNGEIMPIDQAQGPEENQYIQLFVGDHGPQLLIAS